MSLKTRIKHYAPVLTVLTLGGVICLAGASNLERENQSEKLPPTQRERMMMGITTPNSIEGRVTINKTLPVPKGVLMAFDKGHMREAIAFGDIDPDGNVSIGNLPKGEVILVLRPDTESMVRSLGVSSKDGMEAKLRGRRPGSQERNSSNDADMNKKFLDLAIDPRFLAGVPMDQQWLIQDAFSKFGNPRSDDAYRTKISEGINRKDINLIVP